MGPFLLAGLLALEAAADPAERPGRVRRDLGLTGSLRGSAWSSTRSLDDRGPRGSLSAWARIAPRLGPGAALFADGVLGSEGMHLRGRLREAYLDWRLPSVDLRLGRQIVAWGRADALNPTDVVSPRDRVRLFPEDADQRFGNWALRASWYAGSLSLTGLWVLAFEPHRIALGAGGALPAVERRPERGSRQLGLRLEQVGGALDWSLSYFAGFDLSPDLALRRTPAGLPLLEVAYHRVHTLGFDLATTLGRQGLRAEAAYTWTRDGSGRDPETKNPSLWVVVGADRTFRQYLNANLQYFFRFVHGFTPPHLVADPLGRQVAAQLAALSNQSRRTQQGATLRLANQWWHETLEAEMALVGAIAPWQLALRPQVAYAATDRWQILIGGEWYRGDRRTLFGQLRKNSATFVELRLGF